jgi:hypothetical protein
MANKKTSVRWNMINKANSVAVSVTAAAAFIVIFSLVSSRYLLAQIGFQNRVTSGKQQALNTLKHDVTVANQLSTSYQAFISTTRNVIGGDPAGTGPNDGDNGKIILDALPDKYDFPALVTSLSGLLAQQPGQVSGITGTDQQLQEQGNTSGSNPTTVSIPFNFSVTSDYPNIVKAVQTFEHSIRPMTIQTLQLTGNQSSLNLQITAQTYYQPAKNFYVTSKVIQ